MDLHVLCCWHLSRQLCSGMMHVSNGNGMPKGNPKGKGKGKNDIYGAVTSYMTLAPYSQIQLGHFKKVTMSTSELELILHCATA